MTYTGERKNQAVIYGKKGILQVLVHNIFKLVWSMCDIKLCAYFVGHEQILNKKVFQQVFSVSYLPTFSKNIKKKQV